MSFMPAVPLGGYAGWRFLNRTMENQQAALEASPRIQRDAEYFAENIGKVKSAEALVADRRLRSVALGAFGLDGDIDNRFFIRKVLDEGTAADGALANRLSDTRYRRMSDAFGFASLLGPRTADPGFAEEILADYKIRRFEAAVGAQDNNMRLALNFQRELPDLAARDLSENGKWFTVMGSKPMRQVMETALGLPSSVGALDLDKQLDIFRDRAGRVLGVSEIDELANPHIQEDMLRNFFARTSIDAGSMTSAGQTALTLLQGTAHQTPFW